MKKAKSKKKRDGKVHQATSTKFPKAVNSFNIENKMNAHKSKKNLKKNVNVSLMKKSQKKTNQEQKLAIENVQKLQKASKPQSESSQQSNWRNPATHM